MVWTLSPDSSACGPRDPFPRRRPSWVCSVGVGLGGSRRSQRARPLVCPRLRPSSGGALCYVMPPPSCPLRTPEEGWLETCSPSEPAPAPGAGAGLSALLFGWVEGRAGFTGLRWALGGGAQAAFTGFLTSPWAIVPPSRLPAILPPSEMQIRLRHSPASSPSLFPRLLG